MPRFFFFFNYLTKKDDISGTEQKSSWLRVCGCVGLVKGPKLMTDGQNATDAHQLFRRTRYCSHVQTLSQKRHNFSQEEAKGPKLNNASITGQQTCSYDMYGKNDLALQLFFFSSRQLLRFDFNAFCVVLYFHAEILLYLNVFILLNVLNFLVIIP